MTEIKMPSNSISDDLFFKVFLGLCMLSVLDTITCIHISLKPYFKDIYSVIYLISDSTGSRRVVVSCEAKKKQKAYAYSGQCDHYSELLTRMVGLNF